MLMTYSYDTALILYVSQCLLCGLLMVPQKWQVPGWLWAVKFALPSVSTAGRDGTFSAQAETWSWSKICWATVCCYCSYCLKTIRKATRKAFAPSYFALETTEQKSHHLQESQPFSPNYCVLPLSNKRWVILFLMTEVSHYAGEPFRFTGSHSHARPQRSLIRSVYKAHAGCADNSDSYTVCACVSAMWWQPWCIILLCSHSHASDGTSGWASLMWALENFCFNRYIYSSIFCPHVCVCSWELVELCVLHT